jgi:predicted nucleic acid-binding protein
MNPPSTLLDESFLLAVVDSDDDYHDQAIAMYRTMIDDFVAQRCLLVARADHLKAVDSPDLFAPIDKLHVARQHRTAAATLVERTGVGPDQAITLVLVQRHRIHKLATFDVQMTAYDIDIVDSIVPESNVAGANTTTASSTTDLESETS